MAFSLYRGLALLPWVIACGAVFDYPSSEAEQGVVACADGADNDFDDQVDCADRDCDGFCSEQSLEECADGRDNDGDRLTDGADPRCWLVSPPEVERCAASPGLDLVETFDAGPQWNWFGSPWGAGGPVFSEFHRGEPRGRQDRMVIFGAEGDFGWLARPLAFSGSWSGFELSFSTALPGNAILRAAIARAGLVPPLDAPKPGAENDLLSLTIDTGQVPATLVLGVDGARFATTLADLEFDVEDPQLAVTLPNGTVTQMRPTSSAISLELAIALDDQGFRVTSTSPNGAVTELRAPGPSSLRLPPSRLVFWGGPSQPMVRVQAVTALDDVRLHVSAEQPCGLPAPQIPADACEYDNRLEAFGHQLSVARGSDGSTCALITASADAYVDHPEALTAWTSADGFRWAQASSLDAPPVELSSTGALVGAGITHDGEAFHVVVAERETDAVQLGFASGPRCAEWGGLTPGPLLPLDAEPPSYVVAEGQHHVYFTRPPAEAGRRTLWRTTQNLDSTWLEPEHLTDLPSSVASPVAVQRLGARDLVLVYPTAPSADAAGVGVLVSDRDSRVWEGLPSPLVVLPQILTNQHEGNLAFDDFGARSAALSFSGPSGFVLYGGRSALGAAINGDYDVYHPLLSVGTARLAQSGEGFAEPSPAPLDAAYACGNGTCDAREACASCPGDCPCGEPPLLTDVFTAEQPWSSVSADSYPSAVQYLDLQHSALNWSGASTADPAEPTSTPMNPPATWSVLPLGRAITGDFELSFDVLNNWIDPRFDSFYDLGFGVRCSLYVGLGTPPSLGAEPGAGVVPPAAGVFARVTPSCPGKYVARPSVHAPGSVFERDNESFGNPYTCLSERNWLASKPRRLSLRREAHQVTLSVERDNGCGLAERSVEYSGALPELGALLVGFGGGDYQGCDPESGAGTISNVTLRLLHDPERCPDGQSLCSGDAQVPSCIDTATSNEHCGVCGHACAANEICSSGTCNAENTGITWLSLEADRAPADRAPNGELGIDGVLYTFSDGCATLDWDPQTRCVTGTFCEPGVGNYGGGVGFDFRGSTPFGTRGIWNPEDVGVRGLTWEISGTAPGLQVWLSNMEPIWNGQCPPSTNCRIGGAADGTPRAALHGQLLFDDLVKDNWGTRGVRYTFDPQAAYTVDFMLRAGQASGESFAFCIDRLGVIR